MTSALRLAVTFTALGDDPRLAPKKSREMGFAAIQFDAYGGAIPFTELSGSARREISRMLSNEAQQLVGLRVDLGAKGFGRGADVERLLDRTEKAMEACAALATPLLCVEVGPLPEPPRQAAPKPRVTQDQAGLILLPTSSAVAAEPEPPVIAPDPILTSQVDGALAELGRRADRYGVTLALGSELASLAALHRALRAAACPWFGVDLDPSSVLRDAWPLDGILSALGHEIRHVRGRDATAGADRRTRPAVIGAGSTDWPALLADLDASGYHGWMTIDPIDLPHRASAAETGRKRLLAASTM